MRRFFELINGGRFDAAIDLLAEDVVYHNIPLPEMRGRESVRQFHKSFGVGGRIGIDWRLLHIAQDGDTVLTERLDIFDGGPSARIELPTMGSMTVSNGAVVEWRDYFDLASFEKQAAALRG
ncbi:limonene-1,2-epoxide hydrolase family protein [Antarcticirhabdus aurantiaca]|uniref:Nuclear transport factor 2 family protein n=1 Tax=Antarcticirhabdus aurantiaca TaxID=2606717 RepID=A0ACD4NK08_9HYPH|nr:limonene-1,2-epoxide hydrolase family protein [Antarcticirhabdus aurantiaca]WAJ27172.1 nuclear transport factor 2 family protein [Jeongeuplla avenae]